MIGVAMEKGGREALSRSMRSGAAAETYEVLAGKAIAQARGALGELGALHRANERLVTALCGSQTGDGQVLQIAVEELRARRRSTEAALRDVQELADRALDALGERPPLLLQG